MKIATIVKATAAAALLSAGQAAFVRTASAATSVNTEVSTRSGQFGLPGYTTATIIQSFSGVNNNDAPPAVSGYTQTIATAGRNNNPTAVVKNTPVQTGLTGGYLEIKPTNTQPASYTLAIKTGTAALHFISFLISDFAGSDVNSLTVKYENGQTSGNLFAGLAQHFTGSFDINQKHFGNGITTVIFSAAAGTGNRSLLIDNIAAAAPEPATWGMMLLGFGLAGSQLRRRRKQGALAAA